jgi:type IV secretory pathway VirB10-like protein
MSERKWTTQWASEADKSAHRRRLARRAELRRQLDAAPLSTADTAHLADLHATAHRAVASANAEDVGRIEIRASETPPIPRKPRKQAKQQEPDPPAPAPHVTWTTAPREPPKEQKKMAKDLTRMSTEKLWKRVRTAMAEIERRTGAFTKEPQQDNGFAAKQPSIPGYIALPGGGYAKDPAPYPRGNMVDGFVVAAGNPEDTKRRVLEHSKRIPRSDEWYLQQYEMAGKRPAPKDEVTYANGNGQIDPGVPSAE